MNLEQEIKELVIARLDTLPDGVGVSVGSDGDYSKKDLIQHVELGDEIGKKIIEVEMHFLRALKSGALYESSYLSNEA